METVFAQLLDSCWVHAAEGVMYRVDSRFLIRTIEHYLASNLHSLSIWGNRVRLVDGGAKRNKMFVKRGVLPFTDPN